MLYANCTKAPFDDVNVRKAFSMALDRAQIVQVAMYDYTATGRCHRSQRRLPRPGRARPRSTAGAACVTRDVDAANKLLDDAGLAKDGDVRKLAGRQAR